MSLAEEVDLLLTNFLLEGWIDRIPRDRISEAVINYEDYKRRTQAWVDEHQAEVQATIATVEAEGRPEACSVDVYELLWPAFFGWVRQQEPDVLERPGGMY